MHLHPHVEPVDIIAATLAAHIQLYTLQKNLLDLRLHIRLHWDKRSGVFRRGFCTYQSREHIFDPIEKVLFLNKPHARQEDYKPYLPTSRQDQLPGNVLVPVL